MQKNVCAYCGKNFEGEGWPHIEGDSNRGVSRIEQFCSEEHRSAFLKSNLWFQLTKKAAKEAFLVLLFFNLLETLGAQGTQIAWPVVFLRAVDMFKISLSTPMESNIATLAPMMGLFQNCLFNTHCQMFVLTLVYAVTRCISEKRQFFIYYKKYPN